MFMQCNTQALLLVTSRKHYELRQLRIMSLARGCHGIRINRWIAETQSALTGLVNPVCCCLDFKHPVQLHPSSSARYQNPSSVFDSENLPPPHVISALLPNLLTTKLGESVVLFYLPNPRKCCIVSILMLCLFSRT